ncbi:MAG: hypothetical protein ACK4SQ_07910 [Allorhizobium sp.]
MEENEFAKAWRFLVTNPHGQILDNTDSDLANMEHAYSLSDDMRASALSAKEAIDAYLASITASKINGDSALKQRALEAIGTMEEAWRR